MSDIEKKRRGRPKGSVNKNKKPPLDLGEVELPLFGKTELAIPELMAYQTPTGKWKIANPKTQERNLSTRQGVKSVKLVRKHINNAVVITHEDEEIPLASFSKADRKKIDDYDTLRDAQRVIPVANRPEVKLGQTKERGRPETLPKNIAIHKERGTRPGHSKGKKKGKKGKDLSKPIDFGDSDDDDNAPSPPPSRPRTPRPKTPRTPTPRPPPRGSPLPALRMPTNEEMGFDSDGNDIETPSPPPRRARTPTPRTRTPTPKEKTPRPKKSVGRPIKYGEDDEARKKAIKEQKRLSAQKIYHSSLSQEARDKYDAKQAKKAGKKEEPPAPTPALKEATPIPKTPQAKTPTPRPPTPTPPTPQASVSQSSSTSKEDKKAERMAEKIREKATKNVDEKYPDLSPSKREKKIKYLIDKYYYQRKERGKGLVDVFNKVKDTATALVYGRNDYPPQVRTLLEQVKDKVINSIKLVRTPLSSVLTGTLNALSLGQFKKNMKGEPFDKLYHLAMVFTAERENYLLEKNEVINLVRGATIPKGESTDVSPVPHLTIGEMLEATHKQMGDRFFQYNAIQNNCQDFISNVLSANRIGGEQAQNFVKQNVSEILKNAPLTRRITNAITNIGEKFNIISQGAGAEDLGNNKKNKISGSSIKMPRTKLVKGSKEAKEFMAKMRGMRGKKKSSGGAVMKPESESDEDTSSSESDKEDMKGEGARRRRRRKKVMPMPMGMEGTGVRVIHHHHHHHHSSDGMGLYIGGEI